MRRVFGASLTTGAAAVIGLLPVKRTDDFSLNKSGEGSTTLTRSAVMTTPDGFLAKERLSGCSKWMRKNWKRHYLRGVRAVARRHLAAHAESLATLNPERAVHRLSRR